MTPKFAFYLHPFCEFPNSSISSINSDISDFMSHRSLKFNMPKMELLIFFSPSSLGPPQPSSLQYLAPPSSLQRLKLETSESHLLL